VTSIRIRAALVLSLVASAAGPAQADSIDDSLFAPEEKCGYCHGAAGDSATARFPRLGGQRLEYLLKQLHDFRSRARHNDDGVMATNAEPLDETGIVRVARYFSEQPPLLGEPRRDDSAGATLYWSGRNGIPACTACHGAASGNAQRPLLGGQHAGYLEKQLRDLRTGRRSNDPDSTMQAVARALTDVDIQALADYLSRAPTAAASATDRSN
jgi:cytochrome c553